MAGDDDLYVYDEEEDGTDAAWDDAGIEVDEEDVWLPEETTPLPEHRADCWAITRESLSAAQQQDLSMIMNLANVKQQNARALLIHHRWKIDRIHDFLERKGREGLFKEAGIVLPDNNNSMAASASKSQSQMSPKRSKTVTCSVCFEDFSLCGVSSMDCGHIFCNDCWAEHFYASIGKKQILCMEVKCSAICDDAVVRRLLAGKYPAAAKRFDQFLVESYLDNNDSVKWCPSAPHCGRAIRVEASERYCEVECPCGVSFCFNCTAPAHSPCPCAMWEKWDAKFLGESANLKWIVTHTKSCPSCHKPIEKNGGCNYVKCRCGKGLCYACGGAVGSGHNCNRYKEEGQADKSTVRRQMLRYTHYCDRFKLHGDSHKVERGRLWRDIEERMKLLESLGLKSALIRDAGWLARAHRSLLRSRQALSRSYAFAYHMFGDEAEIYPGEQANLRMAQNLFEDQQEQLERNVERLSKALATEMPELTEEVIMRAMQEATNLAKIVETHCAEMYKCIQDELLPLLVDRMNIAAYRPDGPDKAKELSE